MLLMVCFVRHLHFVEKHSTFKSLNVKTHPFTRLSLCLIYYEFFAPRPGGVPAKIVIGDAYVLGFALAYMVQELCPTTETI